MSEKPVLVVQQISCEGPGVFGDIMNGLGVRFQVAEMHRNHSLPDVRNFRALIVMGGPMSVYDEKAYPFLIAEDHIIRSAVRTGVPFLGVCLGGQLLSKALGARVRPNKVKEIGFHEVTLTERGLNDRLFAGMGDKLRVFQWHGDTFSIPRGGLRLATAGACVNQAFRYGPNAYGLQFHIETTPDMIGEWARCYSPELEAGGLSRNVVIPAEIESICAEMNGLAKVLLSNFLTM